jgi:hypothetical protein
LGVVGWSLWKIRNKMAIEKKLIRNHDVIMYNIISLMQQCAKLSSEKEQGLIRISAKLIRRKINQVTAKPKEVRGHKLRW